MDCSKSGSSYSAWLDSLLNDPNVLRTDDGLSDYEALERRHLSDSAFLKQAWESAADGMALKEPDVVKFVNSQAITAYNIKEDWFFDKERSMLDKRIICIAPVARFKFDSEKNRSGVEEQEKSFDIPILLEFLRQVLWKYLRTVNHQSLLKNL